MTDLARAFEILGVSPTDDAKAIRTAWRALVRSYHPDTARTDPEGANKRLTEINVAFDAVSACSSEDLAKLKAQVASRKTMAERLRREHLARQKEARARQDAAQKKARAQARAQARSQARAAAAEKAACKAAQARQTTAVVSTPSAKTRSSDNPGVSSLVSRAEKGFLEAMKACSLQAFMPTRSSYI